MGDKGISNFVFRAFPLLALAVTAGAVLSACGSSKRTTAVESIVTECVLPDDQANSLQGQWAKLPIKVSFHANDFAPEEKGAFGSAIATWNNFFSASKGITIFEIGGTESAVNQTNPTCVGTTIPDGVVIYKRAANWSRSASAVALTTFCTTSASGGVARMYNAIMEFNYRDFFNGAKNPDIESIAAHELGHLLGLDHSCGPLRSSLPNAECPDVGSGHFLLETVMFPKVFFDPSGYGEIKRRLHENDQGRANCLY